MTITNSGIFLWLGLCYSWFPWVNLILRHLLVLVIFPFYEKQFLHLLTGILMATEKNPFIDQGFLGSAPYRDSRDLFKTPLLTPYLERVFLLLQHSWWSS